MGSGWKKPHWNREVGMEEATLEQRGGHEGSHIGTGGGGGRNYIGACSVNCLKMNT